MSRSKDPDPFAIRAKIADMLDSDAGNGNWHDFVGAHVKLARLLTKEVGRDAALKIMRKIADRQGLHGMNGMT